MAKRTDFHKVVIGRADLVYFVELHNEGVPAKVDTGAYRAAIHASDIKLDSKGVLHFKLLSGHPVCKDMNLPVIKTKEYSRVTVENSFGDQEERYEVKLRIKIGPKVFLAHMTLANRAKKAFPILLGRKLLNDRFLVDTAHTAIDKMELIKAFGGNVPNDEEAEYEDSNSF